MSKFINFRNVYMHTKKEYPEVLQWLIDYSEKTYMRSVKSSKSLGKKIWESGLGEDITEPDLFQPTTDGLIVYGLSCLDRFNKTFTLIDEHEFNIYVNEGFNKTSTTDQTKQRMGQFLMNNFSKIKGNEMIEDSQVFMERDPSKAIEMFFNRYVIKEEK